MKKLTIIILLAFSIPAMAQWPFDRIEGNGNLKKQTRTVDNFSAISSSGSWDVMIAYGESNTIQVEGDENLLEYVETKVEDGKLSIRSSKNVNLRSRNKITVYISVTRLRAVSLSGSGDIIGDGKFYNDGGGEFRVSGSGSIKLAFKKYRSVDVHISGSGNIRLSGAAESVSARISGSGNADCVDVIADDVTASVSGSGNIKVYANKSVDASISGSGNVRYKGAATDVRSHKGGSGRVSRI